ncbi:luciferin 4-monooxygenase [Dermacentor silvarum]|uniref:luciferin 4-monooxygenase n=1 Tax=Dermacentor silvarum TaxID=543639 RepID=UPI002101D2C7|nr:luciferin 4-monooxygenase [Dermacentor silvarum]
MEMFLGCGIRNPTEGHDCNPTCKLCGQPHHTGDITCKEIFRTPYIIKKRQWEKLQQQEEEEKKVSEHRSRQDESKTRAPSKERPRSTSFPRLPEQATTTPPKKQGAQQVTPTPPNKQGAPPTKKFLLYDSRDEFSQGADFVAEDELLANVKRKDSTYVLADGITAPTFNRIRDQINVKGWLAANVVDNFTWVSSYEEGSELRYADRAISPENIAFISHTSGTTSVSKSIEVTQQSFIAQICCRDGLRLPSENDVLPTHRSITYFFGFSHAFFMVCCGGKVVLLDSGEIPQIVDALISHNVTSITGNPRGFFGITEHVKLRGNKLPSLKKVISLGVKLPADIAMSVASFFNLEELRDGYGMTEVSGFLTITPAREIASGDVGFPVPGSRMKIVDVETGESLGPMQCGEILFHTPYLMHGYYKNVEATAERIDKDGWLHTGKHSFAVFGNIMS